jgi:glycosyltransferase involved in cell wall biosynthesis
MTDRGPIRSDADSERGSAVPAPLVSVCIPLYNCQEHVAKAIESVLQQTLQRFELIVCDDCSSDGGYEIAERYKDDRIRLLRNETNLGMAGNWNRLLSLATGKYIKVLCCDDYLYPHCLEIQSQAFEAAGNEGIAIVFARRDVVGPAGHRLFSWGYSGRPGRYRGADILKKVVRRATNLIGEPGSVMFRASAVPIVGTFSPEAAWLVDLEFWSRLLAVGDAYAICEPLSAFRVSRGSWSIRNRRRQAADFCNFVAALRRQPCTELSGLDCLSGYVMAHVNSWLRLLVYCATLR